MTMSLFLFPLFSFEFLVLIPTLCATGFKNYFCIMNTTSNTITLELLENTQFFGRNLGEVVQANDIICLNGDLGAGKTTLTQAIARGLEIPKEYYVTSPSFNIFHEYPGRLTLYHMDFYRLGSSDDVLEMGLDEFFYNNGLVVIEWAEKAKDILPENCLHLLLTIKNQNYRELTISYNDDYWYEKVKNIIKRF